MRPSTVNFVCKQVDLRLIAAAGPVVNVRRMLDARRRDCVPSRPMQEPLNVVAPKPRAPTNSFAISSLKQTNKQNTKNSLDDTD